jgi:hypothetical protein
MNSGSVLSFQADAKCGLRPNARQIRELAVGTWPLSLAGNLAVAPRWPERLALAG